MKIGILGGTFDPVHNAHLEIAIKAAASENLDKVLLIPTGHPPHKLCPLASRRERVDMLSLAVEGERRLEVSDVEIKRPGTTYTVDTLGQLRDEFPHGTQFFYIIGTDTLSVLDKWRSFSEIAGMCGFIVLRRPGDEESGKIAKDMRRLSAMGASFREMEFEPRDISSTDIRERSAAGKSIESLVPKAVEEYIRAKSGKGLYKSALLRAEIDGWLKENLSRRRYLHTLAVEHAAVDLAERHGESAVDVSFAALLHDCAKEFPAEKILEYAGRGGAEPDEIALLSPQLLHGHAAAFFAKERFGVEDEKILDAVKNHTMGRPGMSLFEKIIYLADYIDPGRGHEWVDELRKMAYDDIEMACEKATALTIAHVVNIGEPLHPQTVLTYNSLLIINRRKVNGK
ncbi:MAG: nicotinate-nucleotide adenylyltransferase [Christensenellales bacterium]|jgi:nicotinate-nucleotide adenylyltransferase